MPAVPGWQVGGDAGHIDHDTDTSRTSRRKRRENHPREGDDIPRRFEHAEDTRQVGRGEALR